MNRNQRHRRMKARRRECLLLWGVTRFQKLPAPRSGIALQLLYEQAMVRAISDALNNSGTCFKVAESMPRRRR